MLKLWEIVRFLKTYLKFLRKCSKKCQSSNFQPRSKPNGCGRIFSPGESFQLSIPACTILGDNFHGLCTPYILTSRSYSRFRRISSILVYRGGKTFHVAVVKILFKKKIWSGVLKWHQRVFVSCIFFFIKFVSYVQFTGCSKLVFTLLNGYNSRKKVYSCGWRGWRGGALHKMAKTGICWPRRFTSKPTAVRTSTVQPNLFYKMHVDVLLLWLLKMAYFFYLSHIYTQFCA